MNKLPKVFVNKIKKDSINYQKSSIIKENNISLDNILDNNKYPFNHKYNIKLIDGSSIISSIISNDGKYLLTIDNDKINIKDIINIQEIKK